MKTKRTTTYYFQNSCISLSVLILYAGLIFEIYTPIFHSSVIAVGIAYEGSTITQFLTTLHQKYGPIVSMRGGVQTFIFIRGKDIVGEVFNSSDFAFRPVLNVPVLRRLGHGTATESYGKCSYVNLCDDHFCICNDL